MEILGIGPQELIFIIVIALIVLGPKDMQKAGKTIGQYLNRIVKSDGWKAFQQTTKELRDLPTNLMREANMDLAETEKEIRKTMKMPMFPGMPLPQNPSAEPTVEQPTEELNQPQEAENSIQPPSATQPPAIEPDITVETPADISDTPDDKVSPPNQNA
ncbi:MAG: twin-arginine translocase TatA/TatE family subunit [Chloroflexota bacterium]